MKDPLTIVRDTAMASRPMDPHAITAYTSVYHALALDTHASHMDEDSAKAMADLDTYHFRTELRA